MMNYNYFVFPFQYGKCRFVGEFEKLNRIGEGTYGVVCEYSSIWTDAD